MKLCDPTHAAMELRHGWGTSLLFFGRIDLRSLYGVML
jgi:hypothetical protein